jgi:hypothetical protein
MHHNRFRVIVADESAPGAQAYTGSAQMRYVLRIARKSHTGDRFQATEFTDDRLLAAVYTYNVARAVANRNRGILETA